MNTYDVYFMSGKVRRVRACNEGQAKTLAGYCLIKERFFNEDVKEVIQVEDEINIKEGEI